MMGKKALLGMSLDELRSVADGLGMPAFTAGQMARWIYKRHVQGIGDMTDISLRMRGLLAEHYTIGCQPPADCQRSADGTVKYLFPTAGGQMVESVYIPDGDRATLCVSSQVGCRMGCRFCMTGRQGFHGNLEVADILNQIYSLPERERLTNVVFMGQGEPMDNYDHMVKATRVLTAAYGWAWSPRRVTVSTVGVRQKVERFLDESECHLAVSLHSPFPEERLSMMPAESACPAAELVEALRKRDWTHQRRLSFEYIVFGGLNDTPAHARALVRLLDGMECRVNLIRFHEIPDTPYRGAGESTMVWLRDYLTRHGVTTTIRASRGQDIYAACGLLHARKSVAEA
ncbi:MAG TPA: 23S rRNA (adenine(2503)-C(2))-methyltransferase RlmN [Prevotellaceae bacterium]|nr:23S rRNA (adenine(2503)-C(2))-methyltransferase RlmN [Prevotellaceae bacterium]HBE54828.1 23S rRNA (adenine(2503)-C(2))-methyltransferase RlmN [Prevotellaceae bacterium]